MSGPLLTLRHFVSLLMGFASPQLSWPFSTWRPFVRIYC
jgi:hypothetical protein